MKRTGEIVLTIIGACFFALISLFGFMFLGLSGDNAFTQEMENMAATDPALEGVDMGFMTDMIAAGGWYFIIVGILAIILGIVSLVLLKGDKHPKAAGIILIIVAVLSALATVLISIISSILYLVAGILCLVRKQKETFNPEY
ncbi:DUF4064 domain-containing protein [Bacillus timonensis]|uniref:DUF4064 domain-containing protein n=1 Tax=Bacillus timonensis TaxID=1033734 RepID=A0A4S3PWE6_9BACI|nr:DUF4064 domain-containing protein [Bacillus timonensis]THE14167.1 DUF4064 domain-containing protein [Bacillus timonensis]